jgi:colanic acid/amylovoran biosynthesis protein
MRALIINQHTGNHGDEAAFLGLLRLLNRADVEIIGTILNSFVVNQKSSIIPSSSKISASRVSTVLEKGMALLGCHHDIFRIMAIRLSDKLQLLTNWINEADIVLIGPGGENIGVYRDWLYMFNIIIALSLGKTVIFPGNSFGPSGSLHFDRMSLQVLRKCFVVAREEISQQYLKDNGVNASLGSDCALLLADASYRRGVTNSEEYAVFVPNLLWKWHPRFRKQKTELLVLFARIFDWLTERFSRIVVLPQTFPYPNKIEDFSSIIPINLSSRCEVVEHANPHEQLTLISKASCLIGMRYHSIVFAAMVGIPAFAYGYERKMMGFNRRYFDTSGYVDLTNHDNRNRVGLPDDVSYFPKPDLTALDQSVTELENLLTRMLSDVNATG